MSFSNVCISQGSVATHLRCGGNFYTCFVGNFFVGVKEIENRLRFDKVIAKIQRYIFEMQCSSMLSLLENVRNV